jgi:hypothetical protein
VMRRVTWRAPRRPDGRSWRDPEHPVRWGMVGVGGTLPRDRRSRASGPSSPRRRSCDSARRRPPNGGLASPPPTR